MATKEEIIAGLELTVSQAKRTTSLFAEGEYDWKRAGGWTPKEMYAHLAAVAAVIPGLGQGLTAAPEGTDIAQGMDINAMNAQAVGGMASMNFEQIMQAFESNYRKLIDYVRELPDDTMDQKRRFFRSPFPCQTSWRTRLCSTGCTTSTKRIAASSRRCSASASAER